MSRLIDISVRLHPAMPTWPGSTGFQVYRTMELANGEAANVSQLDMDVHAGTHVEAPMHFVANGAAIGELALETFFGPALVVDLRDEQVISPEALDACEIPAGTERVLIRTRNSGLWRSEPAAFQNDYVALTLPAARWVASRGIRLIGIDYLSIQRFGDDAETHRVLMRGGVAILEGLDLESVAAGRYTLVCLPLSVADVEATPVRAALLPTDPVAAHVTDG